jgi:hyperosmotically inducible periplasmic protein
MTKQTKNPIGVRRVRASVVAASCAVASLSLLAACDSADSNKTVGQKLDAAVAKTESKAEDIKDAAKASVDSAGVALRDGAAQAKEAAKQAASGASATSEDAAITASVSAGLLKDPDLSAVKIDVDTANGSVTLIGPAPSEASRSRASIIAMSVKGVSRVDNRLVLKGA